MSYHVNPIVNDLLLTIINDGNGSQCGRDYAARLEAGRRANVYEFRFMAREYGRARARAGSAAPTPAQVNEAADFLLAYYVEHLKEMAAPQLRPPYSDPDGIGASVAAEAERKAKWPGGYPGPDATD